MAPACFLTRVQHRRGRGAMQVGRPQRNPLLGGQRAVRPWGGLLSWEGPTPAAFGATPPERGVSRERIIREWNDCLKIAARLRFDENGVA